MLEALVVVHSPYNQRLALTQTLAPTQPVFAGKDAKSKAKPSKMSALSASVALSSSADAVDSLSSSPVTLPGVDNFIARLLLWRADESMWGDLADEANRAYDFTHTGFRSC